MKNRRRKIGAVPSTQPIDCRFHRNCYRCREMAPADVRGLTDALANPGACLRCGKAECYREACLGKKDRALREFAQSISPDHWTQPTMPTREQIGWMPANPFPGIH